MPLWIFPRDAFLRSCIFRTISDCASSFFIALRRSCLWIFWNFQKNYSRKTARWSLGILCCKEAYLEVSQTTTLELFCDNSSRLKAISILDVQLGSRYASVAGRSCYKDIFPEIFGIFRTSEL